MVKTDDHGVVILSRYWKNSQGGGVREFLTHLTNEYEKANVEYRVIFIEGEDTSNFKVMGSRFLYPIKALLLLSKIRPEVVHSQGSWWSILPGFLWKQLNGTRLIHTTHSVIGSPSAIEKIIMKFLLDRCDVVSYVCIHLKEQYKDAYRLNQQNSVIIYPGITYRPIADAEVSDFKKDHRIDKGQIILLGQNLTAHPAKYEGAKRLILALKILLASYPDLLLILSRNGLYVPQLKKFAIDQGVSNSVLFVGDLDNPLIAAKACDIFTHITIDDGFSLSILEAMSLGKPIVASRVGGIPEAIDGQTGMLVGEDPKEIADVIQYLLENPEIANEMGARARKKVQDRFTWSRTAAEFRKIYSPKEDHP